MNAAQIAADTSSEVAEAATEGARAGFLGRPESSCPFDFDTAQGIIWTQAFRLTVDRVREMAS